MSPTDFEEWQSKISRLSLEEKLIEAEKLLVRLKNEQTPLVGNDGKVTFVFFAENQTIESVFLTGDMIQNRAEKKKPLQRIPGVGIFFLEEHYELNARLQYGFFTNNSIIPQPDPLNKCLVKNSFGSCSEFSMPAYVYSRLYPSGCQREELYKPENLEEYTLPAGALPYQHDIYIFKAEAKQVQSAQNSYSSGKFISIYFNDGPDYVEEYAPLVLQKLAEAQKIPPCLGIFIKPPNWHKNKPPNRETEYGLNPHYLQFLCEELVPFVEKNYAVHGNAESRIVAGASFGGLMALWAGIQRPDIFGKVLSQSGYFSFQNNRILHEIRRIGNLQNRIFFHAGTYERKVGASSLPQDEQDFTEANIRMKQLLEELNQDYDFHISCEGHNWGTWISRLAGAVEWLCSRTASESSSSELQAGHGKAE